MFLNALTARLPLLRATTADTVNLSDVIMHLVPKLTVVPWSGLKSLNNGDVFVAVAPVEVTTVYYDALVENGKTLLLINQEDESGLSINVGEVPVPAEMIRDLVSEIADKKAVAKLLPAFRGLTMKSASEVIRLVITQEKCLTVPAVLRERARLVGKLKGLSLTDTAAVCYIPDVQLSAWVAAERAYFDGAADPRLIPRGLLFDGEPGTGKTQGAKYIAREWGLPLYRLDLASSMAKWVGESEANFGRVLSMLDQEEPCVFLIDEIEKLFEPGEDAGTTSRILSQLLWWLAEHQSRIITVMTTNNRGKLPAELYRSGRIDKVIVFKPLTIKAAIELAAALCTSFNVALTPKLRSDLSAACSKGITPATVTQMVFNYVKASKKCLT